MEENTFSIPAMEQDEIAKWCKRISPIINIDGKARYMYKKSEPDLDNFAYSWLGGEKHLGECVDYSKLEKLSEKKMLHAHGYSCFFKHYLEEVIRQIPKELISQIVAFEVVNPRSQKGDHEFVSKAVSSGFHVSTVRLYKAKN